MRKIFSLFISVGIVILICVSFVSCDSSVISESTTDTSSAVTTQIATNSAEVSGTNFTTVISLLTSSITKVTTSTTETTFETTSNDTSTAKTAEAQTHQHAYLNEWSKDEVYHWHNCEGDNCSSVSDEENHLWNDGEIAMEATPEEDGEILYTCTVCGYTKAEAIQYSSEMLITEEEWVSALSADNFYNVTMHYNDEVWETLPDGTVRWLMVTQEYDGNWLRYRWSIDLTEVPDFDGDTVEEVIENNREYISQNNIYDVFCSEDLAEEFAGLIGSYSDFIYDNETNTYSDGTVILTFSNGKLSSYSYDEIVLSFENYGTTTVNPLQN